jgi:Arc/MetJ family transcription regulator
MRTNIVIDEKLLAEALEATGAKTKREVVELGLAALVKLNKQKGLRSLRGKVQWKGDLDEMRNSAA